MHEIEYDGTADEMLHGGWFGHKACRMNHHHVEGRSRRVPPRHRDHFHGHSGMFERGLDSAPRRLLVPSLLLLLAEKPSHGYAILNRLADMNVISPDTPMAIVYRSLKHMEMEGLTVSEHAEGTGRGPAKKVYSLTDEGWEALDLWSKKLVSMGSIIDDFSKRYQKLNRDSSDNGDSGE